jgi:hypothetical protein
MSTVRTRAPAALATPATRPMLAALPIAALLFGLLACDPAYEPPPKPPASVYIPWQAGPARGRSRRATVAPTPPTGAPSVAPSVELEDVDAVDDAGDAGTNGADGDTTG